MGTLNRWYRPSASLTVWIGLGTEGLSTRMMAPGTGAPLSSETVPWISPVRSWAKAAPLTTRTRARLNASQPSPPDKSLFTFPPLDESPPGGELRTPQRVADLRWSSGQRPGDHAQKSV